MSMSKLLKSLIGTSKEDYRYLKRLDNQRSDYAEQLYKKGFVVIPDYVQPSQTTAWLNAITEYLQNNGIYELCEQQLKETLIKKYPSGAELQIRQSYDGYTFYDTGMIDFLDIHNEVAPISEFRNDAFIKGIIDEAHGSSVSVVQTSFYRTLSLQNPRSFHMDVFKRTTYKAFVYLTDVPNTDFGPYSFINSSHRPNVSRYLNLILNSVKGYPLTDARIHQKRDAFPFLAKKGTLIITNQRGYHRGHPQKDSHERMLLTNAYKPD